MIFPLIPRLLTVTLSPHTRSEVISGEGTVVTSFSSTVLPLSQDAAFAALIELQDIG